MTRYRRTLRERPRATRRRRPLVTLQRRKVRARLQWTSVVTHAGKNQGSVQPNTASSRNRPPQLRVPRSMFGGENATSTGIGLPTHTLDSFASIARRSSPCFRARSPTSSAKRSRGRAQAPDSASGRREAPRSVRTARSQLDRAEAAQFPNEPVSRRRGTLNSRCDESLPVPDNP